MPDNNKPEGYLYDRSLTQIVTKPGVKRDGTNLDSGYYADALWCRFRLGRPKKMGGFREIANGLEGPIRGMMSVSRNPDHIVFNFSNNGLQCQVVDPEGASGGSFDRSPAGWVSQDVTWSYDSLYDQTGSGALKVIAHAAKTTWSDMDSDVATSVYMGDATSSAAIAPIIPALTVSGGVVVLQPYLFVYGSNGLIKNSAANQPQNFLSGDANAVNVSATKIVKGLPLRGGANAPSGLFWSLDSLIRVGYVGGNAKFRYDTLQRTSLLSTNAVIDFDGIFFWASVDRFQMYNGVVKELPNSMNQDFFFDNLNWKFRNKVWATAVPRWGEIWWFFPKGTATECNHAIVYNVREDTWYDTPIARSAGIAPRVLHFPIWSDSAANSDVTVGKYRIFRHETGTDAVYGTQNVAIKSFFETSQIGYATGGVGGDAVDMPNVQTRVGRIEPDFTLSGSLAVSVEGTSHAQGTNVSQKKTNFTSTTKYVDLMAQQRITRLRFESNVSGGDYHMGKVLLHLEPGDGRQ